MPNTKRAEQGKPSVSDLFSPVLMIAGFFFSFVVTNCSQMRPCVDSPFSLK